MRAFQLCVLAMLVCLASGCGHQAELDELRAMAEREKEVAAVASQEAEQACEESKEAQKKVELAEKAAEVAREEADEAKEEAKTQLAEANRALSDLREGRLEGSAVLVPGAEPTRKDVDG